MRADPAASAPAYKDANVLRWLGAYTLSVTGDLIYFLALTWAVTRAGGPAQVGVVLAVGAVPRAVLMLGGGVIADRFGPRRVLIGSDGVRSALVLAAAAWLFLAGPDLAVLFVLALVFGVVDAVFMPAVGALPPRIAERSQLGRVQGMRALAVRASNAVGPLLAAAALAAGGPSVALALAGTLFIVSALLLIAVRVGPVAEPQQPATPWAGLRDGLRYLRGSRPLSRLVIVIGLSEMCFSGPVAVGLVLLTDERQWGAATLGWILTAFSVGGAVSGVVLTAAKRVPRASIVMAGTLLAAAVLVGLVGNLAAPALAVGLSAVLGATSGAAGAIGNALLQVETDPRYLGRVSSVTTLCTLGLSPLLYPLTGVLVAALGAGAFFLACAAVCTLAAVTSLSAVLRPLSLGSR